MADITDLRIAGSDITIYPVVVLANFHRFPPRGMILNQQVRSRMLLWTLSGQGRIISAGRDHELPVGTFAVLPWRHDIRYQADTTASWLVAGVHLIPDRPPGPPLIFQVDHNLTQAVTEPGLRHDAALAGLDRVLISTWEGREVLQHLAQQTVHWFRRGPDEPTARLLGQLFLGELLRLPEQVLVDQALAPLFRALRADLARPWTVEGMARQLGVSPPTLTRRFRACSGVPPLRWLIDQRLHAAQDLLVTTSQPINEIAASVGIPDSGYLARLFRRRFGLSPGRWRQRYRLLV